MGYVQLIQRHLTVGRQAGDVRRISVFPGAVLNPEIEAIGNSATLNRQIPGNFIESEENFVPVASTLVTIFAGGNDANTIGAAVDAGLGRNGSERLRADARFSTMAATWRRSSRPFRRARPACASSCSICRTWPRCRTRRAIPCPEARAPADRGRPLRAGQRDDLEGRARRRSDVRFELLRAQQFLERRISSERRRVRLSGERHLSNRDDRRRLAAEEPVARR